MMMMMMMPRLLARILSVAMLMLGAGLVSGQATSTGSGQAYPAKPIRMLVPEPGGGVDVTGRLIAQGLSSSLGQQVIVENRGAASGAVAGEILAKAAPDGYTLLYYGNTMWLLPLLRKNVPFDPLRDFMPISLTTIAPYFLYVHPSMPVKSVKELIALAKAKPGELNYSSSVTGSSNHLSAELFKAMAGVNIVRVPYKGTGAAVIALLTGEAQLLFASVSSGLAQVKAGRLRVLAVAGRHPSALVPGVPTVAASGLPGYEAASMAGMFAPAKAPAAIINRLNQEIVRILNQPDLKEDFSRDAVEAVGSSPDQFAAVIRTDIAKWGKVIKDAGIREE